METRPYSSGRELQPFSPHAEKIILRELRSALQCLLKQEDPDINPADADFFALGGVERIRCKYRQHVLELSLSHGFFRANPRKKRKKKAAASIELEKKQGELGDVLSVGGTAAMLEGSDNQGE